MPLPNGVQPDSSLTPACPSAMYMGNRGNLHDDGGRIRKNWVRKAWFTCAMSFKGRKRQLMSPGQYTELFFLDEATALAAGHRPCAECRNADYKRFKQAWETANGRAVSSAELDLALHEERLRNDGDKNTFKERTSTLPDGVMFRLSGTTYLKAANSFFEWTSRGYVKRGADLENEAVEVLTPASVVKAIAAGYSPALHMSASERQSPAT